jgi:hypothetical protein
MPLEALRRGDRFLIALDQRPGEFSRPLFLGENLDAGELTAHPPRECSA